MVNVDKDGIRLTANNMLECIEEYKNEISEFVNIINDLNDAWNGNIDASNCINNMNKLYLENLSVLYLKLQEYQVYLQNIPGLYDLLDEIYVSKKINI